MLNAERALASLEKIGAALPGMAGGNFEFWIGSGLHAGLRRFMAERKRNAEGRRPRRGALRLIDLEIIGNYRPAGWSSLPIFFAQRLSQRPPCLRVSILSDWKMAREKANIELRTSNV